ncbi:MAG: hypothetical protein VX663_10680 [Pseudomonadota bacterium]|nr:hypothetical protein [Pseudomonadota bacterium]
MIHLVCALPAEARPVVDHLRLRSLPRRGGFALYGNRHYRLAVSGVGQVNAGAAVALLAAQGDHAAWINVGVAGQAESSVGAAALAAKVTDAATGRACYPQFPFATAVPRLPLRTQALPRDPAGCPGELIDMEAAGFCAVAARFATLERVHCLKVVSDNGGEPPRLAKRTVADLIEGQLQALDELIGALTGLLDALPAELPGEAILERFCAHHHYSVSQIHELRRLLARWCTLDGGSLPEPPPGAASAREVLAYLRDGLAELSWRAPLGRADTVPREA